MGLNAKRKRFVQEYLIDLNATQAAIRAGYSAKTAKSSGQRLLTYVEVAEAITKAQKRREKRMELNQDRVVAELAKLALYDIRSAVQWGANPTNPQQDGFEPNGLNIYPVSLVPSDIVDDDTAAAISEVSLTAQGVRLKMADKRAALETLLKHFGGMPLEDAPPLTINLVSSPAVGDVRVTRSDG